MSLEQTFSQKLTLDKEASSSSTNSSEPTISSSKPTLAKGQSFRGLGRRRPSPLRNQPSLSREDSVGGFPGGSPGSPGNHAYAASTVGGVDRAHSIRLTRKIFHNWRSACGKTKDRTKDFIRRWKTLPENHPDFDNIVTSPTPSGSGSNIPGSTSASIYHAESHGGFAKLKNVPKKSSEHEIAPLNRAASVCQDDSGPSGSAHQAGPSSAGKSSTGWTVHVWATYVQRGSCDDEALSNEQAPPGRDFLSDFQKVKLTHFFRHVLDMNHDDVISAADFVALNQRIRHYIEWSSECIEFHILKEVHSGFLECFLNQPLDDCSHMYYCRQDKETRDHVNVDEWLDVWGELLHTARNLEALPLWLQYFPKILFQVINKSGSTTISKEELRAFYTMFLGIDFRVVNDTLDSIYSAMTDGSRNKINYSIFKLCFANFLFAKFPHGPGQYLFGICSPQTLRCSFPIDYSALNTPPDDLEPYDPEKDKNQCNRRSVIV